MLGFDINSELLHITLPGDKIAGARVLSDQMLGNVGSGAIEVATLQQIRGHIEHFRASNAIWRFLTGPIDFSLRYTDERAIWANFPVPEVWISFRNSTSIIFCIMESESMWRKIPQGSLIRPLTPEQRLSIRLDRVSPRFLPDRFVWVSVGATLDTAGGVSRGGGGGGAEFFRAPTRDILPFSRPPESGGPLIGECELEESAIAILARAGGGRRNIALRTDNQNVLSWVENARPQSPVSGGGGGY